MAEITCVQVLGSIKDEQCFSRVVFIIKKLKNCLLCHLNLCTWFYVQQFYKLEDFPFKKAITLWATWRPDIALFFKAKISLLTAIRFYSKSPLLKKLSLSIVHNAHSQYEFWNCFILILKNWLICEFLRIIESLLVACRFDGQQRVRHGI